MWRVCKSSKIKHPGPLPISQDFLILLNHTIAILCCTGPPAGYLHLSDHPWPRDGRTQWFQLGPSSSGGRGVAAYPHDTTGSTGPCQGGQAETTERWGLLQSGSIEPRGAGRGKRHQVMMNLHMVFVHFAISGNFLLKLPIHYWYSKQKININYHRLTWNLLAWFQVDDCVKQSCLRYCQFYVWWQKFHVGMTTNKSDWSFPEVVSLHRARSLATACFIFNDFWRVHP